jgi:hypothetical protein
MNTKIPASVRICTVTPEQASAWLQNLWPGQRELRNGRVDNYAADMLADRFRLSSDAILRIKGKLANGQHRLRAVVETGTSQPFLVMESEDEELYRVIDAGLKRTVSDSLRQFEFAGVMPSIARWVVAYESGSKTLVGQYTGVSQAELISFCEKNNEILVEAARFILPLYNSTHLLPQSISGGLYALAKRKEGNADTVSEFLRNVYEKGGEDASGDLRNRLIKNRGETHKMAIPYVFALTLRAYVCYRENERPRYLRVTEDTYPVI